eukprot:3943688-Heterocapsa_arctica.AAC.1
MGALGVQGYRGDLSPSPLDAQRKADCFSPIMNQNTKTDNQQTYTNVNGSQTNVKGLLKHVDGSALAIALALTTGPSDNYMTLQDMIHDYGRS